MGWGRWRGADRRWDIENLPLDPDQKCGQDQGAWRRVAVDVVLAGVDSVYSPLCAGSNKIRSDFILSKIGHVALSRSWAALSTTSPWLNPSLRESRERRSWPSGDTVRWRSLRSVGRTTSPLRGLPRPRLGAVDIVCVAVAGIWASSV